MTNHMKDNNTNSNINANTNTNTTTSTNINNNNSNNTACRVLDLENCSDPIKSPTQISSSSAQHATCSYEGDSEDRVTAV